MSKAKCLITIGFSMGLTISCVETTTVLDPNHCANNEGDAYCLDQHPDGDLPYCRTGTAECDPEEYEDDYDGCVAEPPEEACHNQCGDSNPDCDGVASATASTTGTDSMTGDPTPGTMTDSSTQGPGSETSDPTTDTDTSDPTTDTSTDTGGCTGDDQCPTETPFCEGGQCVTCDQSADPGGSCTELDPETPICNEGACVQCTDDQAAACNGTTPVCGNDNTCHACQWHSDCPDSACHLDGPEAGACFDAGDVVPAVDTDALETAVNGAGTDANVVVMLTSDTYNNVGIDLVTNAEVAIIGSGSETLQANSSNPIVSTGGSSILYISNVEVSGNLNGNGVACSGTSVWLDDSLVRGNQLGLDVSGGCAAHLRRSIVRVNNAGGIVATGGATEVFVETSAISNNGNGAGRGIQLTDASLQMTFSTVVRNDAINNDTILCAGDASAEVTNSILIGRDSPSIDCSDMTFAYNATDEDLGGTNVEMTIADETTLFIDFFGGDYRLSATGETELMDIAMWTEGDPLFDFDGDPILTDMPSFPGYDQP